MNALLKISLKIERFIKFEMLGRIKSNSKIIIENLIYVLK